MQALLWVITLAPIAGCGDGWPEPDCNSQDLKTYEKKFILQGHKKQVIRADFSPDGNLLATISDDKSAKFWDMARGQVAQTLTEKNGAVRFVYFSPNSRLLATSGTKREYVELLSVPDCKVKATIPSDREAHAAFSPDGRSIAVSNKDGSITVWDISAIK
jgi:WD40 repeat protein